jgi:valyl-tRNA synthetase
MDTFQFGEAGRQIYDFFWSEFCDWYLEISKIAIYRGSAEARACTQAVLIKVLDESLRLLHPFIPFVTEETWGYLKQAVGSTSSENWPAALIVAPWPTTAMRDEAAEADMNLVMDLVRAIRNARAEYDVKPGQQLAACVAAGERAGQLRAAAEILSTLARLDPGRLVIAERLDAPEKALTLVTGTVTTYLPLADLVDFEAERGRLAKELADTEAQITRTEGLLQGPFAQRAPAAVVQRERDKLGELEGRKTRLRDRLAELGG